MNILMDLFLITLPEMYIVLIWGALLFGYRYKDIKTKALYMALIMSFTSNTLWFFKAFSEFRIVISFITMLLLFRFYLNEKWGKSLFITLFSFITLLISEIVIVLIFLQFVSYDLILENLFLKAIIVYLYLTPLLIGSYFLNKKGWSLYNWANAKLEDKRLAFYWIIIFFLVLLQLFMIIYLNYSFYVNYTLSTNESFELRGIPLITIGLVFVNLLLIIFIVKLMRYYSKKEITLAESSYNLSLENLINKLRMERHDFVNEVQTINGLVQEKMYIQLEEYMSNLVHSIRKVDRTIKLKNITVSAYLHTKIEQIENDGVRVILQNDTSDTFNSIKGYDLVKIISNLIDNAHRAVTENSVIDPCIEFYWGKIDNNALIRISNNGPRIEKRDIDLIFKEGYTTKKETGNSGYGLPIIKSIVNKYKGLIKVESNDNLTSFTVIIPL